MLKVREGDIRLQLQRFLQFVPAEGSVGFGDDQCNIPAGAHATGGYFYCDQCRVFGYAGLSDMTCYSIK